MSRVERDGEITTRFIADYETLSQIAIQLAAAFARHESREDLLRRSELLIRSAQELHQAVEALPE